MTTHLEQERRGFTSRSRCYRCANCNRATRATGRGDNENCDLCVECYDIAGIENGLSDGTYEDDSQKACWEQEIENLKAAVIAKGGKP